MNKRTIQDVKINKKSDSLTLNENYLSRKSSDPSSDIPKNNSKTERFYNKNQNKKNSSSFLIISILVLLIGLFYLSTILFEKSTVRITPKQQTFKLDNSKFFASRISNKDVSFEIMIISDKDHINLSLDEDELISEKAKGEIIFYNEYSNQPYGLKSGDFVTDEDGKVYVLDQDVSIPGYSISSKNETIKGEIKTSITSFLAGESYNGEPDIFYLDKLRGDLNGSKIYGKLTTPLSGGYSGQGYRLNDEKIDQIMEEKFSDEIKNKNINKLVSQIPDDYLLYKESIDIDTNYSNENIYKEKNISFEINNDTKSVIIKEEDLSRAIIKYLLPDILDEEFKQIEILNLKDLSFNFVNKDQVIDKDLESFNFYLNGEVELFWHPRVTDILYRLIGLNKNEINNTLEKDVSISEASFKVFPLWNKSLPEDKSRIKIILE